MSAPKLADRYELREKLASSTTATVWRAHDRRSNTEVALKVASPTSSGVSGHAQLAAEAAAGERLEHPAIVPVLSAHLDADDAALAFPLIDGENLADRLRREGRLPAIAAARIAADVAAALAHAHGRDVVHRDVKPGNIFVGGDDRARLFDFGISAMAESGGENLVGPGLTTGTLPYMAPEQLAGLSADPATDIYAVGVLLYEMLAGSRPYQADTTEAMAAAQEQPPAPIAGVPLELETLVTLCLDHDPAVRPRASALEARLRAWLAGLSEVETVVVPAAPATSVVRASLVQTGRTRPALAGMSVAAGIVAGLVILAIASGGLALAMANFRPTPTDPPASTLPSPILSPLPTPPWPPSPDPAPAGGSGGGGGGSTGGGNTGNHGHGNNGKGDHGGGHGKGH